LAVGWKNSLGLLPLKNTGAGRADRTKELNPARTARVEHVGLGARQGQVHHTGALRGTGAAVLLGLAEIELEYRRERQAAGIEVAKKRGIYLGRKKGSTKCKPDRARELRDQGLSVPEIATALGVSERTAFRYIGKSKGEHTSRIQSP